MRSTLKLPEPRSVTSTFIVAAPARTCDVEEICRMLPDSRTVRLDVETVKATYLRPDRFYLDAGTPADYVRRVHQAPGHLLVTVAGAPVWPSRPAGMSRDLATRLAYATGGLVLDPVTGSIEPPGAACSEADPGGSRIPLGAWMTGRVDADGERVELTGLARFGLPDMYAFGVRSMSPPDMVRLLRLVGTGMLYRFWSSMRQGEHGTVVISNPLLVDSNFVHLRLGDHEHLNAAGSRAYVKLQYVAQGAGTSSVLVTCPDGSGASLSDWWHRTAATLLPAA